GAGELAGDVRIGRTAGRGERLLVLDRGGRRHAARAQHAAEPRVAPGARVGDLVDADVLVVAAALLEAHAAVTAAARLAGREVERPQVRLPLLLDLGPRRPGDLGERAARALAVLLHREHLAEARVADLAVQPRDQRVHL